MGTGTDLRAMLPIMSRRLHHYHYHHRHHHHQRRLRLRRHR